jgi:hypothetical protein
MYKYDLMTTNKRNTEYKITPVHPILYGVSHAPSAMIVLLTYVAMLKMFKFIGLSNKLQSKARRVVKKAVAGTVRVENEPRRPRRVQLLRQDM